MVNRGDYAGLRYIFSLCERWEKSEVATEEKSGNIMDYTLERVRREKERKRLRTRKFVKEQMT